MTSFELAINWIIDLIKSFSSLWSDLATPFFEIGDWNVSWLEIFSIGFVGVILTLKIVDVINPIG